MSDQVELLAAIKAAAYAMDEWHRLWLVYLCGGNISSNDYAGMRHQVERWLVDRHAMAASLGNSVYCQDCIGSMAVALSAKPCPTCGGEPVFTFERIKDLLEHAK
jgi:hypothetical protein